MTESDEVLDASPSEVTSNLNTFARWLPCLPLLFTRTSGFTRVIGIPVASLLFGSDLITKSLDFGGRQNGSPRASSFLYSSHFLSLCSSSVWQQPCCLSHTPLLKLNPLLTSRKGSLLPSKLPSISPILITPLLWIRLLGQVGRWRCFEGVQDWTLHLADNFGDVWYVCHLR